MAEEKKRVRRDKKTVLEEKVKAIEEKIASLQEKLTALTAQKEALVKEISEVGNEELKRLKRKSRRRWLLCLRRKVSA